MMSIKGFHIGVQRRAGWLLIAVLLCSMGASAQLTVGDNLKMNLNGSVGFAYNGSFGNSDLMSSHGQGLSGSGDMSGYYFNPNFLNFQIRPYFDRNQTNTELQTITHGSGIGGSVGLFGGSRFPGSISFGKGFNSNSTFQIAGVPTVATDSSGQDFGISWSAIIPNLPSLTASYSMGSSKSSLLGLESEGSTRSFSLNSGYQMAGFNLSGNFSHINSDFTSPDFLTANKFSSDSSSNTYGAAASHPLPLNGSVSLGWSHSNSSSGNGYEYSNSYYNAGTYFSPWQKVSLFQNVSYVTNLSAAFAQSALNGASVANANENGSSGLFYTAGASYSIGHGASVSGRFNHRIQWLMGREYEDSQYGGAFNYAYANRFFGMLSFGFGLADNFSENGNTGLGFSANVGLSRHFGRWDTSADYNYSQNVQTQGILATTSSYSYGASVRRKIGTQTRWSSSFRGSHSGISMQAGNGNHAESMNSSILWRKFSFAGSYSQSSGQAVFTSTGELTATPLGSLLTNNFLLFDARAYSASASALLFRRLSIAGGYSTFTSSNSSLNSNVTDSGNRYNLQVDYRLRKFAFMGGFSRSMQEISARTVGPVRANAFYLSVMRCFNVF